MRSPFSSSKNKPKGLLLSLWSTFTVVASCYYTNLFSPDPLENGHAPAGRPPASGVGPGDWIAALGDWGDLVNQMGSCQQSVARLLKDEARRRGRLPLVVLNLGDSFYWAGSSRYGASHAFRDYWYRIYGDGDASVDLTRVPWLTLLGNHDYGVDDPCIACPHSAGCRDEAAWCAIPDGTPPTSPYALAPGCAPCRSKACQGYAGGQFSWYKHGDNATWRGIPRGANNNWFMPDFSYFYQLPSSASPAVEIIALDLNGDRQGGWGGHDSHSQTARGRRPGCTGSSEAWARVRDITSAAWKLLAERARARHPATRLVIIANHYDDAMQKLRDTYVRYANASSTRVVTVAGHNHIQTCYGTEPGFGCTNVVSGGGGGCCPASYGSRLQRAGFHVWVAQGNGAWTSEERALDSCGTVACCLFDSKHS